MTWNEEWRSILTRWKTSNIDILPKAIPKFLGYVIQQHNLRTNAEGMTRGWQLFGNEVDNAVKKNIVERLIPYEQVAIREKYCLGAIPNLHSLIPYSLNARKPVYKCTSADGLNGAHISKARESAKDYEVMIQLLLSLSN